MLILITDDSQGGHYYIGVREKQWEGGIVAFLSDI